MQTSQPTGTETLVQAQRLLSERRVDQAIHQFQQAEHLGANICSVAAGLWECWMLQGAFEQAWQESDRIRRLQDYDPHRLWDGMPLDNRHLMLRCLHGYGDAVQFLRYLPLLRKICRSLTIQVAPALLPLVKDPSWSRLVDAVITWEEKEPLWDTQIECMELPYIFRTTLQNIPPKLPPLSFLKDLERSSPESKPLFHVGLIWNAGEWNPSRSIPITNFLSLTQLRNIAFHNLQGGPAIRDWPCLEKHCCFPTAPIPDGLLNMAQAISQMDLVLTVDTLAAHLAGAQGIPVWLLLQHSADWRWMIDRTDSPWYPSMTIFRRGMEEDWDAVIMRVQRRLRDITQLHQEGQTKRPDIQVTRIPG